MTNTERVKNLHSMALALAPCLRDKFDFSTDQQFVDWAKISYKAAEALLAETETRLNAAAKVDFETQQRVQIAVEREQRLAQQPPVEPKLNGETK